MKNIFLVFGVLISMYSFAQNEKCSLSAQKDVAKKEIVDLVMKSHGEGTVLARVSLPSAQSVSDGLKMDVIVTLLKKGESVSYKGSATVSDTCELLSSIIVDDALPKASSVRYKCVNTIVPEDKWTLTVRRDDTWSFVNPAEKEYYQGVISKGEKSGSFLYFKEPSTNVSLGDASDDVAIQYVLINDNSKSGVGQVYIKYWDEDEKESLEYFRCK